MCFRLQRPRIVAAADTAVASQRQPPRTIVINLSIAHAYGRLNSYQGGSARYGFALRQ
jgi:hypothetical protein